MELNLEINPQRKPSDQLGEMLLREHDELATLVQLLKEEQQSILQRSVDTLQTTLTKIEDQVERVRHCQSSRNEALSRGQSDALRPDPQGAVAVGAETSGTDGQTPGVAARVAAYRGADRQYQVTIAQRIDGLLTLVREITWQNHVLLSHSLHFLHELLAPWLDPRNEALTLYGGNGIVHKARAKAGAYSATA